MTDAPDPEDRLQIDEADGELRLTGDVDPHTAELFREALSRVCAAATGPVVVDMEGVTFVDSSGLRVLADAQRALEDDGQHLVVRNASSGLRKLLELTGLDEYVRTEP